MLNIPLSTFTKGDGFKFHAMYGKHDKEMCLHSHVDFSELVIVTKGTAVHVVNQQRFFVKKGDVFVIDADTIHGYEEAEDFEICNIMYQKEQFFDESSDMFKLPGFQALFVIEPKLRRSNDFSSYLRVGINKYQDIIRLVDEIIKEYQNKKPGWKIQVQNLFFVLTVTLSRMYKFEKKTEDSAIGLAKAAARIESEYLREISIDELAALSGFSPRHFIRRYYEMYQITPHRHLKKIRLVQATQMLKESGTTISEIALACGFPDSNYFARIFKSEYGISPSAYRKENSN